MAHATHADHRTPGHAAESPGRIPWSGWKQILRRLWSDLGEDDLTLISAGVAFYAFLALFPALAALVSIYGMVADPSQVQSQLQSLTVIPAEARTLLQSQLVSITQSSGGSLGAGAIIGLILSLWSASKGMKVMIEALNIAYDEKEKRGFVRLNGTALLLTLGAVVMVILALGLVVALPAATSAVGLPPALDAVVSIMTFAILAILLMAWLAVIYRYAPSRDEPRWHWVSWGAALATLFWIAGSAAFSWYVSNFGSYNKTYGAFAAVVILMLWFFLSVFVVLLGAELNAEAEQQTLKDTTKGSPEPIGRRGATVADRKEE